MYFKNERDIKMLSDKQKLIDYVETATKTNLERILSGRRNIMPEGILNLKNGHTGKYNSVSYLKQ